MRPDFDVTYEGHEHFKGFDDQHLWNSGGSHIEHFSHLRNSNPYNSSNMQ